MEKLFRELLMMAPHTKKEMKGGSPIEDRLTKLVFNFYLFSTVFFPVPLRSYQEIEHIFMKYLLDLGLTPSMVNLYTERFNEFYKEMFMENPIKYHMLFFKQEYSHNFPFNFTSHYYPYIVLGNDFPLSYFPRVTIEPSDLLYIKTVDGCAYLGSGTEKHGKKLILSNPKFYKKGWKWVSTDIEPVVDTDIISFLVVYRPYPGVIVD